MKAIKIVSWFLGVSMFMVGFLKFFNPFKSWYGAQVTYSGLGSISYVMGILGELAVGITLIVCLIYQNKIAPVRVQFLIISSSALVVVMMAVGFYVHFHPNVPADVLPLKIKPPFIPGMFLVLGVYNIYLTRTAYKKYTSLL